MSFISSSYDEGETIIPAVSETEHKLVQDLYDKVKGTKQMKIKEDVFTRKEELSKEESEWLIDFIMEDGNAE